MKYKRVFSLAGMLMLVLWVEKPNAATWQDVLQSRFDIVETFDQLQDWTPGGQWYSGAGCSTCASNSSLPKKVDGSRTIWGLWNSKGLSLQYTPGKGRFAKGDVITGETSGITATVRQVWNLEGKSYIQLTNSNAAQGTYKFVPGETIRSGSKTGYKLQWPLFIGDHGPAKTWRGTGKSLVMDLGDNDNIDPANPTMAGLGAQRMAVFFGDGVSGKSGYKKIHVFFMMKISPTFFNRCLTPRTGCVADGYESVGVVKVFELASGFTGVSQWGTPSESAQISKRWRYRLPEYGVNYSLFTFYGGGMSTPHSIFFEENDRVASGDSPDYTVSNIVSNRMVRSGTTLDVNSYISSGDWFGVEVALDLGTMGNSDGSTDFWIYDKNGEEMGRFSVAGQKRLMYFDHLYNKLVLGGNRLSRNGKTGSIDSRKWIDDVIINGSRIGPDYFQLLKASSTPLRTR